MKTVLFVWRAGVNWIIAMNVFRLQDSLSATDSLELSRIQLTPPKRTRRRQDSLVVSGVAVWTSSDAAHYKIYLPIMSCYPISCSLFHSYADNYTDNYTTLRWQLHCTNELVSCHVLVTYHDILYNCHAHFVYRRFEICGRRCQDSLWPALVICSATSRPTWTQYDSTFLPTIAVCDSLYMLPFLWYGCLQCFDAVGWAAGRASGL